MTGTIIQYSLAARASAMQLSAAELPSVERQAAELTGFQYSFASYFAVYFVAMLCWRFIDPDTPIVSERERILPQTLEL
jgi:ACS family glucarate transporter-like MFS transporter